MVKGPRREANNLSTSSSKVKKIWIYTSTPPFDLRQIKTDRPSFVSVNRMRAGHTSLKASLNRFNFVSTAECECGDGLQTEEHIFWDCKLYEYQRATLILTFFHPNFVPLFIVYPEWIILRFFYLSPLRIIFHGLNIIIKFL